MTAEKAVTSPVFSTFPAEAQILEQLRSFKDPQARLAWISRRGSDRSALPADLRLERNRVDGCLSKLWFAGVSVNGEWRFECDSDSLIVRGLACLVCEACHGRTSMELLQRRDHPPLLSDPVLRSLTQSRRSGLTHLWKRLVTIVEASVSGIPPGPG